MSKKTEVSLTHDILYLGATRPAMMFGVTFDYMVVNGFSSAMIFLAVGNPFYMLLIIPGHFLGALICLNEPRTFSLVFIWLQTVSKCSNRVFWGGSTYVPL